MLNALLVVVSALGLLMARILGELLLELVFDPEIVFGLSWVSLKNALMPRAKGQPVLRHFGWFLAGALVGAVGLAFWPQRLFPPGVVPGATVVAAPLITGLIAEGIGRLWDRLRDDRPSLLAFGTGAVCAFGMTFVRFAVLVIPWSRFR